MSPTGLRERKKLKTKEAIQREAMRLFQEQGYEETTIEEIAQAAEISPSTFFNYFPTKEDVVLYDRYDPIIASLMLSRPSDEPPSVVMKRAFEALALMLERDRDVIVARATLALQVPALRARFWEELERARDLVSGVIAARTGRNPDDFELRVLSMVLVTAAFEATQEWLKRGGKGSMFELVNQALEAVRMSQRLDALASPSPSASK
ncbi:MAG TPA: TetR family transcriptional regulator [Candidatus Dormibacteraeota bacterium]|nr:TetR family transcriptional regulator [Candidatus Dormibacteraeota bacterium]